MSKDKNVTATKDKAPAGSSIQARCKTLVSTVFTELKNRLPEINEMSGIEAKDALTLSDLFSEKTYELFTATATELADSVQRGLPLATRLVNVQAEIAAHYGTMKIVNGAAVRDEKWEAETERLMTKRRNIERAIKAEKAPEATAETEATAEAATV